jgi:hypothetical protein
MQSPWPYQPFPPGPSGHASPYPVPPPHSGALGPYGIDRWMIDPHLSSPYSPFGPIIPHKKRASAAGSSSTGCCIIL